MNVLDAESGSCAKPSAACCAATKALVVVMVVPLVKSASGSESGSSGGVAVKELASPCQQHYLSVTGCVL